jgi:hypothetical protein
LWGKRRAFSEQGLQRQARRDPQGTGRAR